MSTLKNIKETILLKEEELKKLTEQKRQELNQLADEYEEYMKKFRNGSHQIKLTNSGLLTKQHVIVKSNYESYERAKQLAEGNPIVIGVKNFEGATPLFAGLSIENTKLLIEHLQEVVDYFEEV